MTEEAKEYTTDREVLEALKAPFPTDQLKTLSGRFQYIPEPIVRKRLEDVLGLSWDWEIITETESMFKSKACIVIRGRLSLELPSGRLVSREAHGGSTLDNGYRAGDAHKSAGSNALKKAAYLMGIGSYLGLNNAEGIDDTTSWGSNSNSQASTAAPGSGWANTAPQQEVPAGQPAPVFTSGGGGGWNT